jgi:hypothetical protein
VNPRLPDGGIFIGIFIGDSFFQLAVLPAHSFVVIISVSSRSGAGKDALPTDRAAVGRLRARVREGGATEEALRAPGPSRVSVPDERRSFVLARECDLARLTPSRLRRSSRLPAAIRPRVDHHIVGVLRHLRVRVAHGHERQTASVQAAAVLGIRRELRRVLCTGPHTTASAWWTPILKDFARRISPLIPRFQSPPSTPFNST